MKMLLLRQASRSGLRRAPYVSRTSFRSYTLATLTNTQYQLSPRSFDVKLHSSRLEVFSVPHRRSLRSTSRPFTILGIQQVAVGSLDKHVLSQTWQDIFGLKIVGTHRSEKENVDEDILRLGREDSPFAVEVDLMSPVDPEKSPKVHVPPLNHIGLWVDNLESAVEWMTSKGVRFTPGGIRKGASGHNVTFIHPKGNDEFPIGGAGALIELVQAPPDVVAAFKK